MTKRKVQDGLNDITTEEGLEELAPLVLRVKPAGGKGKIGQEVCSRCGQPLIEMLWSKSDGIYILTCDNAGCACYRNPVKTIVKEA